MDVPAKQQSLKESVPLNVFAFGAELRRKNLTNNEKLLSTNAIQSLSCMPQRIKSTLSQKVDSNFKKSIPAIASPHLREDVTISMQISERNRGKVFKRVGDVLIDTTNLLRNAPSEKQNIKPPQTNTTTSEKSALQKEVEELLGKRSLHADDAEDEWFAAYSQRMKRLSQREYMQEKSAAVQYIHIKAFQCSTCTGSGSSLGSTSGGLITESFPTVCRQRGHVVTAISTIKRFFECNNCRRRDFTLGGSEHGKLLLEPNRRCQCGSASWLACGSRGSGSQSFTSEPGLVMAMTDWTNRKERLALDKRISSLK